MTPDPEAVQSTPVPQISKSQSFSTMDTAAAQSITVPKSTKVCIVCSYSYKAARSYAVIIADLQLEAGGDVSDESFVSIRPTFLIDRDSFDGSIHTFCVLNSTLYMIELGFRRGGGPRRGKSVYTLDLSPYLKGGGGGGGTLGKDVLLAAPEMLHPKLFPFATPTPDGKRIVVFSSMMPFITDNPDEQIDFEVYDPKKRGGYPWRKLPSLRDSLRGMPRDIEILGFTFLTNSKMLFRTTVGIFVFDIDVPVLGWCKEDLYFGANIIPFGGPFFVSGDDDDDDDEIQLCVAGTGAYDISPWAQTEYRESVFDSSKASWFPISSFARDFRYEVRRFMENDVVYNEERRHLQVVHLQTAVEKDTWIAYMLLDVAECNLEDYRKEVVGGEGHEKKKCLLNASLVKSFKFKLDKEPCWEAPLLSYFIVYGIIDILFVGKLKSPVVLNTPGRPNESTYS
ncbi:cysteine-rich RLK (RECEPTOR-like protein kinase)16 [Striga asiatica]|uniref:Cysteine-rich RLK (RECEPTOR-like protein kinase)16 n=1 Tax=Striga asiatica TaxID=4170 RepID=A0A5A7Q0W5_STRAF|nr:cysteine-rich RLK (RECEPTOR-like protein kinase)16 [Striga asiatica]